VKINVNMKASFENLTKIFDEAMIHGVGSLSAEERRIYLIQDFILEWEINGLTGYFYNRLSNRDLIADTIGAMQRHGLSSLADILIDALAIFHDYAEPIEPTTWGFLI
jgi:hypothetical protein